MGIKLKDILEKVSVQRRAKGPDRYRAIVKRGNSYYYVQDDPLGNNIRQEFGPYKTKEAAKKKMGSFPPARNYRDITEADSRKPRKKGQKRKSSKHSDLYTDEDPKGTIKGLGFKDAITAKKSIGIINKAKRHHAHKVQATLVMKQRAKVAKERTKDPEKKKNLNKAYQIWSNKLEQLKKKTKK